MRYTYNEDKWATGTAPLYNSVTGTPVFSNEGAEPVTLQQLKDWGKIEQDVDDSIITALGKAARLMCEKFTGIGFITRTIVATINNADGGFQLPYGPITVAATYTDLDLLAITVDRFTRGEAIATYTGGYTTLPEDLKTALKAQFLFLYENRGEGSTGLSPVAKMILEPLRTII